MTDYMLQSEVRQLRREVEQTNRLLERMITGQKKIYEAINQPVTVNVTLQGRTDLTDEDVTELVAKVVEQRMRSLREAGT